MIGLRVGNSSNQALQKVLLRTLAQSISSQIDIRGVLDRAFGDPVDNQGTFLAKDYLQDAVIRCLEILVEATKRSQP